MNKNTTPYNIQISEKDLPLDDHSLFLKLYEEFKLDNQNNLSEQEMTEELTRLINISKSRTLCDSCEGYAFLSKFPCFKCNARGYID